MIPRRVLRRAHPIAGILAWGTILTFWTSTAAVELFGGEAAIVTVKQAIPWGLLLLVPALAVTGASGFRLAGRSHHPRVLAKKRRMPVIAGVGILVLAPCALWLAARAGSGDFGTAFALVQAVELLAGALNLALLTLSLRDGLRLTARRRVRAEPVAS